MRSSEISSGELSGRTIELNSHSRGDQVLTPQECEVIKASEAFEEAERSGDLQFLEHNMCDSFVGVGPSGLLLTKGEWLDRYRSLNAKHTEFLVEDKMVRIFESSFAVLNARQTSCLELRGQTSKGEFRVCEVFRHQEERWILVNRQLSPIH